MIRFISMLFMLVVTSLFLFPFNLPVSITVNTKMILAVIGVGLFGLDKLRQRALTVPWDFIILSLICAVISIWAFFTTTIHGAADYAFAKYIISVWVWLGGAYAVVWLIKAIHGKATEELVGNYLIAVCVAQCLLAYSMTIWPAVGRFVDSLMGEGQAYMSVAENRLYGLGAALDPAGLRFSAVLIVLSGLAGQTDFDEQPLRGTLYFVSFAIISVFGNMISRSTSIGVLIAIVSFAILKWPRGGDVRFGKTWGIIGGGLLVAVTAVILFYQYDLAFRNNLRFGFEGFFSLVEKGEWRVSSNEILKGMVVWPETLETWLIGDGFFDNPDIPDRFGQLYGGYYMKTDIGYLRYIFYFGCIGLAGMILAFAQMTVTCIRNTRKYTLTFLLLFAVTLIGWVKVSSDVIMVFAPFLILAYLDDDIQ